MNNFNGPFEINDAQAVEWLETNRSGAFAASTVIDCPMSKYHGLLVTPIEGAEGRYHILSAVDAAVSGMPDFTLGTNRYRGAVHPESYRILRQAELLPWPAWEYSRSGIVLRKEVFMRQGEKAVYVVYTLNDGAPSLKLDLKFLFTFRNSHNLTLMNTDINTEIFHERGLRLKPYEGLPEAEILFSGEWENSGRLYWDYNVEYQMEERRGLEYCEDRFVPGRTTILLKKGEPFVIRAAVEEPHRPAPEELRAVRDTEFNLRQPEASEVQTSEDLLRYNARHFLLVNPGGKKSVNAGYPWFGEWGRDTMIALPGLTCFNGMTQYCCDVLCDYISMIKDGLLPNTLGATQGFTSYNSIDAGLLFCRAVINLIKSGYGKSDQDKKILNDKIKPAVRGLVQAFLDGRVPGTQIDGEGLLLSGNINTQLTWMDAKAWGKPVTPRHGYAVEINALWYDALVLLKTLSEKDEVSSRVISLINKVPLSFRKKFWIEEGAYLSDTVEGGRQDGKIRPNMLFASSASEGLLEARQIKAVVAAAEKHLLTPLGLRTLSPEDPDFKAVYSGGPDERDSKYHQGTVWPWLTGIMVESSLRASDDIEKTALFWQNYLDQLLERHIYRQGWGFVSEIFDGKAPDEGKGCFAQAWSSGEIIRAYSLISEILK